VSLQTSVTPPPPEVLISNYIQPAKSIRQDIRRIFGNVDRPLYSSIESLLRDPNPSPETISIVGSVYRRLEGTSLHWLEGALGFFLFSHAADREQSSNGADEYLKSAIVRAFVLAEYEINIPTNPTWILYCVGTTSYILRASNGHAEALKLIKPTYFDRRDIGSDTAAYKLIFSRYQGASPSINGCGSRFILMEFIEGKTLGWYLTNILPQIKGAARLTVTRNIVSKLCSVLHEFHEHGIQHLDLSPENIILTKIDDLETNHPPSDFIRLIDFGPNHILRQGVGTATEFEEIRSYVAPEVISNLRAGTYLSDAYSLGRIFLQLIVGDGTHTDLSHLLDRAWVQQPQFASLIEELIDENPDNRLIGDARDRSALISLSHRVELELELQVDIQVAERKSGALGTAFGVLTGIKDILKEMDKTIEALNQGQDADRRNDVKRLKTYCSGTGIVFLAVLATFGFVTFDYKDWAAAREFLFGVKAVSRWAYLPGLLVGLSFSVLASRYYLNIFARLSTRPCSVYGPFKAQVNRSDLWMRINAWSFGLFTIGGMLISARLWPIICALAVLPVGINNYYAFKLSEAARKEIDKTLRLPASNEPEHFLIEFSSWGRGMGLYAFVLICLWPLLSLFPGLPRDQWIYAVAVIMINRLMIKRQCTRLAPLVRGGLHRLVQRMSRVARIRALQQSREGKSSSSSELVAKTQAV